MRLGLVTWVRSVVRSTAVAARGVRPGCASPSVSLPGVLGSRPREPGFTLVELMVAVSGGLMVAIAVFMLARDASRFYQHESRVADAALGAVIALERLKSDLARAGFMTSPNVQQDPTRCEPIDAQWPAGLRQLASLRIEPPSTSLPSVLSDNGLSPDSIVLAGNYASNEEFPTAGVLDTGANYVVVLQARVGPLPRLGYWSLSSAAQRTALLRRLFPAGRALRIVDPAGRTHYATIQDAQEVNGEPQVVLGRQPLLALRGREQTTCALTSNEVASVNPVSFVRYELRQLDRNDSAYAPLFSGASGTELEAWEAGRTELVREELDVSGAPIAGTLELVAEYAVDLKFGLSLVSSFKTLVAGQPEPDVLRGLVPGDGTIPTLAGSVNNPAAVPQRVRAVRVRLSVRSRVPDRSEGIVGLTGPGQPLAAGLYRMRLGAGSFARVRTLQADVALPNHAGVTW